MDYSNTPHKTIDELRQIARERIANGEAPAHVIRDLVEGYHLGWQSANHMYIAHGVA